MTSPSTTAPRGLGGPPRAPGRFVPATALGWGVLFFVCLQLLLNFTLDRWRVELRDPEYAVKVADLRARIAEHPGSPIVLMLGSSRAAFGFAPESLPEYRLPDGRVPVVFNFGFYGAGPEMQLICLNRLLAEGIRPDAVFVECWPPVWSQTGECAEDGGIITERQSWNDMRLLSHYGVRPDLLLWNWCARRLAPWYSSRAVLMSRLAPGWVPAKYRRDDGWVREEPQGWRPCRWKLTPAQHEQWTKMAIDIYRPIVSDLHHGDGSRRALQDLLALCRRQNIRTTLIFLPEATCFRACYSEGTEQHVKRFLEGLARTYQVRYVDARAWSADDDLIDGVHLRPDGARHFTARFGREVLQPMLTGRP